MQYLKQILAATCIVVSTNAGRAQLVSQTWVQRFDGPTSIDDYMEDIQVDSGGNLYVVGGTYELVSPGSYYPRFLTIKYAPDGSQLWFRTFAAGPANLDASLARSVAVDGQGNVLVAGSVTSSKDWGLVKYDPDGNLLWNRTYALGSASLVSPEQVAVDGSGSAYMTGSYGGTATTVKYDAAGNFQWDVHFDGTGVGASSNAVALDGAGNAYVAGSITVSGLGGEFGVHKLDSAGNVLWFHTFGAPGSGLDVAYDIAVDGAGNVLAAGAFALNTSTGSDVALVKLDSGGGLVWQRLWDGPAGKSDVGVKLALDSQDGAAIAGYSRTASSDYDALAVKYSASGLLEWSHSHAGAALFDDYAWDVGVDANDSVVIAGELTPLTGGSHYFAASYDTSGAELWEVTYGGPINGSSYCYGLAIDGNTVYLSGDSDNFNLDSDVATIRYESGPVQSYCTSQINSQGCAPFMGHLGAPSATAGSGFHVTVTDLLSNKSGILFYSLVGANNAPFNGGTMCAQPPTRRTPMQTTGGNPPPDDCSGAIAYDFNAWIALGKDPALVAGQQVWAQFWSRDPQAAGTSTNLSDALTFVIGD